MKQASKTAGLVILQQPAPRAKRGGAPAADCGPRRPSQRGRWRALSLGLVYVAAAIHFAQWKMTGRTLTPVEPSEAMQTLGSQALVNAGFVFFVLLILSTFVFGRFFCGWGCHIVALQDLCTWMLRRAGLVAKPFRSRLLVYVPLFAALWMFVMPTLVRVSLGQARGPLRAGFVTDEFWTRFPSWPIALLTFVVCGFVIVYLLGNKGFCTYACPYGGFFGLADQVAPGKIRVTDACEQCGHCTATCTSNVRVHEEVHLYGMVVNPGCMKCMDCVNVCPKNALYFGFGPPSVAKGRPRFKLPERTYDYTWPEEIVLAVLFLASIVVLWGLYDRVPFLLALGLSALSSAALITIVRLFYTRDVRFARFQLRRAGHLQRAGLAAVGLAVLWIAFLADAAVVKAAAFAGSRQLDAHRQAAAAGTHDAYGARHAVELLELGQRFSLVPMARLEAGIAEAQGGLGNRDEMEAHYRRAIALSPDYTEGRVQLARSLAARGDTATAITQLREAVRIHPETPDAAEDLADLLMASGGANEARTQLASLVKRRPDSGPIRLTYGVVLAHLGEVDRAIVETQRVVAGSPELTDAPLKLGMMLAHQQRLPEALQAFERAIELDSHSVPALTLAARVAGGLERWDVALRHLEDARQLDPFNRQVIASWAALVIRTDQSTDAIATAERAAPNDRAARFRLVYLYRVAGRSEDAARLAAEFPELASTPSTSGSASR